MNIDINTVRVWTWYEHEWKWIAWENSILKEQWFYTLKDSAVNCKVMCYMN